MLSSYSSIAPLGLSPAVATRFGSESLTQASAIKGVDKAAKDSRSVIRTQPTSTYAPLVMYEA